MADNVKHPEVTVKLTGDDGNAFMIIGRTSRAMQRAGVTEKEIDAYRDEAMAGAYDNVLQTTMRWVEVE